MAFTDINSEDRLVQKTFADYLHSKLGWDSVYAWNEETFGPRGTFGRDSERDAVLKNDLRETLALLNPTLPDSALKEAFVKLTTVDYARSMVQHNHQFYKFIRDGVPVSSVVRFLVQEMNRSASPAMGVRSNTTSTAEPTARE